MTQAWQPGSIAFTPCPHSLAMDSEHIICQYFLHPSFFICKVGIMVFASRGGGGRRQRCWKSVRGMVPSTCLKCKLPTNVIEMSRGHTWTAQDREPARVPHQHGAYGSCSRSLAGSQVVCPGAACSQPHSRHSAGRELTPGPDRDSRCPPLLVCPSDGIPTFWRFIPPTFSHD